MGYPRLMSLAGDAFMIYAAVIDIFYHLMLEQMCYTMTFTDLL